MPTKPEPNQQKTSNPTAAAIQIPAPGPIADGLNVNASILAAHRQISAGLGRRASATPTPAVLSVAPGGDLAELDVIVGTAIGTGLESGGAPGEPCLVLYTVEDVPAAEASRFAIAAFGANALSQDGVPVRVVRTGPIDLLSHRARMRPAAAGISCGHFAITAGTIGVYAKGKTGNRAGLSLLLSNNHVLANVNAGNAGDEILQPGKYDGGTLPGDQIGVLERFVTINFNGPNAMDAATAIVDPALVRKEFVHFASGAASYFRVSPNPVPAVQNMSVGKVGRTTGLTQGLVTAVGATINVNMGGGRLAQFVNQIEVRGIHGNFSAGGDSGSLIWTWDEQRSPIGLLFAGGGASTFANPIGPVLTALDIDLDT